MFVIKFSESFFCNIRKSIEIYQTFLDSLEPGDLKSSVTAESENGSHCIYDNNTTGDSGLAIYEFDTTWNEAYCAKLYLWFVGDCDSPYISNYDLHHLKEIDSGISTLRLRIKLREWIRNDHLEYITTPQIPIEVYNHIHSRVESKFSDQIMLTNLTNLVELIKSVPNKCGESLLFLHDK